MPFEELDKKILEAAKNHHPAYDETAWLKMEKQLDKYLPVEQKKKRRAAFWLLLLLLTAGSAGYLLITRPGNSRKSLTSTEIKTGNDNKPAEGNETAKKDQPASDQENTSAKRLIEKENTVSLQNSSDNNYDKTAQPKTAKRLLAITNKLKPADNISNNVIWTDISDPQKKNTANPVNEKADNTLPAIAGTNTVTRPEASLPLKKSEQQELNNETTPAPKSKQNTVSKKSKKQKGNGLFFSIGAGPDISAVGLDNPGKLKMTYDAGIGYKFGNRISIQTGFYSSRKIYTATASEYNAPDWWLAYYPNLQKAEADCKVYEIPVLVSYHFTNNKKVNWFGTAGLSSYLMKKETYKYYYKTSWGQPVSRSWTYNNENKHFFNVITLAGGYERTLNKNVSLSFSPYIKLPLQGVGAGKIKLNSAGIMVSINISPFAGNR